MQQLYTLLIVSFATLNLYAGQISKLDNLPPNPYAAFFEKAYGQHPSIPRGVLEAVAFTNTRLAHVTHNIDDAESCVGLPNAYGVMGLVADGKNYFRNTLSIVSLYSGIPIKEIISSSEKNILAFAAAYDQILLETKSGAAIEDQVQVLAFLSELPGDVNFQSNYAMNTHLYSVFSFLSNPVYADAYKFPLYKIDMQKIFGAQNLQVLSASFIKISSDRIANENGDAFSYKQQVFASPDYGPAIWDPAPSCNYSSGRSQAISAVTIHTVQGSYAGCISWFKNCAASVAAHYVIRSSDGQVTQMVLEANTGYHVGSQNPYTIGIEHEGFVNDASWYTTAMYQSSANLCKDICNSGYGINPLRTGFWPWLGSTYYNQSSIPGTCSKIKGHQHYPSQSHTDPGPNWNWDYFFKLINPSPAPTVLTSATGNFYDSGGAAGNYSDDERLVWTIAPTGATSVTLTFNSFNTENTWDYLYVYNGTDVWAPLIGYYTGTSNPGTLVASSGSMTLEFRSDCTTPASGWNASWTSNVTTITPTNLAVTGLGCPSLGVNLNWQNSGANWVVDVSDDPGYSYFWSKGVTNVTTTGCPGSFALNTNPNNFLAFQPSTTYYWRIWDGTSHTAGSSFTTPNCVYMATSCTGTFDDTGGPSAAYAGNEDWTNVIQPSFASSVTMTFSSFDLETNFDSLWIYDGQPIPPNTLIGIYTGIVSPGTVIANSGVMSLRFKSDPFVNNAGWTASWTCVSTTAVEEQKNSSSVTVSPNPFAQTTTLEILGSSFDRLNTEVKLFDVYGKEVLVVRPRSSVFTLDRGKLLSGIYFYEVLDSEKTIGKGKLIIE